MKKCLLLSALLLGTVAGSQAGGLDVRGAGITRPHSPEIVLCADSSERAREWDRRQRE